MTRRRLGLISGVLVAGAAFLAWPLPTVFDTPPVPEPLQITDRSGRLLYSVQAPDSGRHQWLPYEQIPTAAIDALIATEDRTFWWHPGVSARGIARATLRNLEAGEVVEGGSTITQQLVRQYLQPERRTIGYKIREALVAIKLDARWSKEKILEEYLNYSFFGQQSYGLAAASETYFGKGVHELSLAEHSLLIGLLKAPSTRNPVIEPEQAKWRQADVLAALVDTGEIDEQSRSSLYEQPLLWAQNRNTIAAPHFVFWLLQQYPQNGLETGLETTIDLDLQSETQAIVKTQLARLQEKNVTSAAVVILDAKTGDILTMVGSADYFDESIDGAVNVATSLRQPGSTLKPFTYALALESGQTAATAVADTDYQLLTQDGNPYTPRNYDYELHGLVSIRDALANSYNIPAVRTLEAVGIARLQSLLTAAGITSLTDAPEHYGLALTLGSADVRLLELVQAYAIFARGGKTLPLRALQSDPVEPGERLISADTAWLIADILSDQHARTPEFGTDNLLNFDFPVAAKTGTTRNARDNWVIGFTPERIVGVWVGNADSSPMRDTSGITGAGPIFHDVMLAATKNTPRSGFVKPASVTSAEICVPSGKKPTELCQKRRTEFFAAGTEPTDTDDIYQLLTIDTRNNLLAGSDCAAQYTTKRLFTVFPPAVESWAQQHGYPVPPRNYSPLCTGNNTATDSWIEITSPAIGDRFALDPLVPDEYEQIWLRASASRDISTISWYIDGELAGTGVAPDFALAIPAKSGQYSIRAQADQTSTDAVLSVDENT